MGTELISVQPRVSNREVRIELIGSLNEVQRARLLEMADRCPVHRTFDVHDRDSKRTRFRREMTFTGLRVCHLPCTS